MVMAIKQGRQDLDRRFQHHGQPHAAAVRGADPNPSCRSLLKEEVAFFF